MKELYNLSYDNPKQLNSVDDDIATIVHNAQKLRENMEKEGIQFKDLCQPFSIKDGSKKVVMLFLNIVDYLLMQFLRRWKMLDMISNQHTSNWLPLIMSPG